MSDREEGTAKVRAALITPRGLLETIGVVVTLLGLYHGLNYYIESKVDSRIRDPVFLAEIARSIRPSVVFDANGRILADFGAMSSLKGIAVTPATETKPLIITIEPKEFLGVEPVLESLDHDASIAGGTDAVTENRARLTPRCSGRAKSGAPLNSSIVRRRGTNGVLQGS